jgi:hypothetical protein
VHGRLGPTLALAAAAAGALVLLLWASLGGPVSVTTHAPARLHISTRPPSPPSSSNPPARHEHSTGGHGFGWLGELLNVVFVIGACLLAFWVLRRLYELATRHPRQRVADVDAAILPGGADAARLSAGLASGYAEQATALVELPPRNGIVRAWVLFEEAAARAGVRRAPHETPTDFVVRLLDHVEVDRAAVDRLRALYVEARFSDHPVGDREREQARTALDAIHDQLAAPAPTASGGAQ